MTVTYSYLCYDSSLSILNLQKSKKKTVQNANPRYAELPLYIIDNQKVRMKAKTITG